MRPIAIIAIVAAICLIALSAVDKNPTAVEAASGESALEARLGVILSSIDGVGDAKAMINADEGVLVVARGADDIAVRLEIIRAVKALLGIDSDRIEVLAMGG